ILRFVDKKSAAFYLPQLCSTLIPVQTATTVFPYTTLFRSAGEDVKIDAEVLDVDGVVNGALAAVDEHRDAAGMSELDDLLERRRSEEHTSELQSRENIVCRRLLEEKRKELSSLLSTSIHLK